MDFHPLKMTVETKNSMNASSQTRCESKLATWFYTFSGTNARSDYEHKQVGFEEEPMTVAQTMSTPAIRPTTGRTVMASEVIR